MVILERVDNEQADPVARHFILAVVLVFNFASLKTPTQLQINNDFTHDRCDTREYSSRN